MRTLKSLILLLALAVAGLCPARAEYPDKPVRIIVQVAAGSSIDISARIIAEHLTRLWGQQVVVFNQPGAGGALAARAALAAPADGSTLFLAASSIFIVLPQLQPGIEVGKLEPLAFVSEQPMVFATTPALPVKTLPELIAWSKAQAGGMNVGVITRGGLTHLTAEWFRSKTGAEMTFVYYPGTPQALTDVTAGRVPMMVETLSGMVGAISGGTAKMLAVASRARLANFPDVPTLAEAVPGFEAYGWTALVAPPGTPQPVVQKVGEAMRTILADPDVIRKFADMGSFTRAMSTPELAQHMKREQATWQPVIEQVGIKAQ
jgi:tripartite-type tricarboxylate transporter receptor subunit TctC